MADIDIGNPDKLGAAPGTGRAPRRRENPWRAVLCAREVLLGGVLVAPGDVPWLPREDWPDDVIVSRRDGEVRLVAIYAREPGCGAFSRLVNAIAAAGLTPVVVGPLFDMPDILARWGWCETVVGETFEEREDQWRPTPGWLGARLAV